MTLISERVGYLLRDYSAQEISEITSLSLSSITPTLLELEPVDPATRKNVYNLFHRTVYADLRAVGASAVEARRYRSKSIATILNRLGERTELIDDLANRRLQTYISYLQKTGKYVSDEDTLATLKQQIAKAMGKSKLPPSHYDYDSYPTLTYGSLPDDY